MYAIILSLAQQSTSNWLCPNRLEAGISLEWKMVYWLFSHTACALYRAIILYEYTLVDEPISLSSVLKNAQTSWEMSGKKIVFLQQGVLFRLKG